DYFASTHDVAPTLISMAGARRPHGMDGFDLSPLLRRRKAHRRRFAYGGYSNHFYVRDGRWAMIAGNNNQGRMLFDLRRDPREVDDVAREHYDVLDRQYRRVLKQVGGHSLPYYGKKR